MTENSHRKIEDDNTKNTQLFPNGITAVQYFAILKNKYDANIYENSSPTSLLYLILRKAELDLEINSLELNWLKEQQLFSTLDCLAIKKYQSQEKNRLEKELSALKTKYKVPAAFKCDNDNRLYSILWKLEAGETLKQRELNYLKQNQLDATLKLVEQIQEFVGLKVKYCSTQYQDNFPDSRLYKILKQIDSGTRLIEDDIKWLTENNLLETLEFFKQQEATRDIEFLQLKEKYGLTEHLDNSWVSPLYSILKKIENGACLTTDNLQWLKQNGTACKQFAESEEQKQDFIELKRKFLATQYQEDNPSNPLYGILKKIETCQQLQPTEIEFLKKNGLSETAKIAKDQHFNFLKSKYRIVDPHLPFDPFYEIMCKLEKGERLDELLVTKLMAEEMLWSGGEIAKAHYRQEAQFHEKEYERTKSIYLLPTISSEWRKAQEPQKALAITQKANLAEIKDKQLKSRICVTRGAAFRDIDDLEEAKKYALFAFECQPDTHQPCTLMGAICYDEGRYPEGDDWFEKARKRGADVEEEIERYVKRIKDKNKQRQAAEYLVKKDSFVYAWAKVYLEKASAG